MLNSDARPQANPGFSAHSAASAIALLPDTHRREFLASLSGEELAALEYAWEVWARPDQLPPPCDWRTWLMLAGRGSGKTRASAETVRSRVETARARSIGLVGPTADTLRRDQVKAIIECAPAWNRPIHEPSQRRLVWPDGAIAYCLSSEEPDRIRGLNLDFAWGDELTSWSNADECWSNLQLALRIPGPKGDAPASVVSTTPKRQPLLRAIMADPSTVITRASTFANAANLDPATLRFLTAKYGNTTLGRQELEGELLDDVEGALWTRAVLEDNRVATAPDLARIVVAIDPAGSSGAKSDETGIVAAGITSDRQVYVLADISGRYTPAEWARRAVGLYKGLKADRIVAERNFGGEMVLATIRGIDWRVPVRMVTASRGKAVRAEPIAALYEQGRVHHVGMFPALEDQLCGWNPAGNDRSPDRLDALVWAVTELSPQRAPSQVRPFVIYK